MPNPANPGSAGPAWDPDCAPVNYGGGLIFVRQLQFDFEWYNFAAIAAHFLESHDLANVVDGRSSSAIH